MLVRAGVFLFCVAQMLRAGEIMADSVKITAKWLQSLSSPTTGRVWYADADLPHFQLCATHTGAKIFYRVGRVNGKATRIRLGAHPAIPVRVAREMCETLNGDVAAGRNVRATQRATSGERTLKDAYDWWLEYYAKPNKRTWARDKRVWERDVSQLGNLRLSQLTRPEIIELVAKVGKKFGPGAGNRVIELIRGIYSVAIENDWAIKNPASKITKHRHEERDRFLQPDEVPAFFTALQTFRPRIRDFFLLCLFTGARRANVMAMRWDEIDIESWAWKIPTPKSKNKKVMIVPLVIPAIEILMRRSMTAGSNPWVFPSDASKTGHYMEPKDAWKRLLKKANLRDLTIHDLRRTLGSWQAGQGVSLPIIGKTLGHKSESSTRIYARLANDPVLLATQNAVDAIQNAAQKNISEKSPKLD